MKLEKIAAKIGMQSIARHQKEPFNKGAYKNLWKLKRKQTSKRHTFAMMKIYDYSPSHISQVWASNQKYKLKKFVSTDNFLSYRLHYGLHLVEKAYELIAVNIGML